MRSSENQPQGRQRFGFRSGGVIATPDRPAPPPTQPRPDTTQPAPEQRPVKPEEDHTVRNIVLVTTGLGVLGAGAYAAYETIPAVHERVDSFLNSFTDKRLVSSTEAETKNINPEEVFDSAATKGTLKVGVDAAVATPEETVELFKNAIVPGEERRPPTIRIPVPAKIKEGQGIEYSHHILTNDGAYYRDEPDRKPPPTTTFFGMDLIIKESNTEIPLLAEQAEVFQFPPVEDKGRLYFRTLVLKITLPNGNPIFATIVSPEDIRHLVPEDIVKNAPVVAQFPKDATPDIPYIAEAKDGIPLAVKNGEVPSILKTTRPNTHILISFLDFTPNTGNSGNLPFNFMEVSRNNRANAVIVPPTQ